MERSFLGRFKRSFFRFPGKNARVRCFDVNPCLPAFYAMFAANQRLFCARNYAKRGQIGGIFAAFA